MAALLLCCFETPPTRHSEHVAPIKICHVLLKLVLWRRSEGVHKLRARLFLEKPAKQYPSGRGWRASSPDRGGVRTTTSGGAGRRRRRARVQAAADAAPQAAVKRGGRRFWLGAARAAVTRSRSRLGHSDRAREERGRGATIWTSATPLRKARASQNAVKFIEFISSINLGAVFSTSAPSSRRRKPRAPEGRRTGGFSEDNRRATRDRSSKRGSPFSAHPSPLLCLVCRG